MKRKNKNIIILIASLFLLLVAGLVTFVINKNTDTYTIKGKLKGGENNFLVLMDMGGENPKLVDTIFLSSSGRFSKKEKLKEKSLFILQAGDNFITICPDRKEKIKIEGEYKDFASEYKIQGSKESENLRLLAQRRIKYNNDFLTFQKQYNNASGKEKKLLFKEYSLRSKQAFKEEKLFLTQYIEENKGKLSTIIALYTELLGEPVFSLPKDENIYKKVLDGLNKTLPNNPNTLKIKSIVNNIDRSYKNSK